MADRAVAAWAKPGSAYSSKTSWRERLSPGRSTLTQLTPGVRRHALGVLLAISSVTLLSWGVNRSALWLDEGATSLATQRTWPHLWLLLRGTDAPLVPYYTLLKVLNVVSTQLFPQLASHPEVLYRWPSVLAMSVAVWVLIVWLGRFCTVPAVLSIGVALLATGGISRYGQEARPYPFIVLFAVLSTVLWTRLIDGPARPTWPTWRSIALYALSLVLLVSSNSLTATLVFAHLAACLVAVEPEKRWATVRRTIIGGAIGGLVVSPVAVNAALHGGGASYFATLTPIHLSLAFIRLFSTDKNPFMLISAVLVLAILGLPQVFLAQMKFIARLAACWAIVPPIVLLPAVVLERNLLIGRYLLFTVPGWAILAGLGVITVAQAVRWLVLRLRAAGVVATTLGAVTGLAMIAMMIFTQVPTLQHVREVGGKGEDIRPALADANLPKYAGMPIYTNSGKGTVEFAPYGRADEARLIGRTQQRDASFIWPTQPATDAAFRAELQRTTSPIVVLIRGSSNPWCPSTRRPTAKYVEKCLPWAFQSLHYRATIAHVGGLLWTFAVVSRPADGHQ